MQTAVVYILGQMLGAYFGYALLRILMSDYGSLKDSKTFCQTLPSVDVTTAFVIEFLVTMILILVCCGVWDPRNSKNTGKCFLLAK